MHKVKQHPYSGYLLDVMLSGVFLVAGTRHLIQGDQTLQRHENARFVEYVQHPVSQ